MTSAESPVQLALIDAGLGEKSLTSSLCTHAAEASDPATMQVTRFSAGDHHILPYGEPGVSGVQELTQTLQAAEGVILVFPVYNFNMNATLKAIIEHGGPAMAGKVVGLMASAGGRHAYMSFASAIQGLMFDLRCWIVPRQVYALGEDFTEGRLSNQDVLRRVGELVAATADMAHRLRR
ncbi:MAG: NAD(P)H-dependent oxidoreductase [Gemmatimonadetes bacterium]|jgi:NAD(P)H-dependent FMN reductase|nr:NAD(P)H-dependent oxidoreductase [Gemmatimonadota bacterium]MBT5057449.1 NAD(P)H-dependent oxidoreductase [Gemmatimonadota bacterium]MBT5143594.1 NAD(P)H-dependent oxidoreductase [Gemmatimonadota bacterium]MBT5588920.1 NAD(P)H-dependent oxidoreductase [Gemmatimonadota bacterium]MBT5961378.1 NAD(P)H-dependent oxidoreductase [Gemmatimonadota bacterium]